jgi:hypothetical protein
MQTDCVFADKLPSAIAATRQLFPSDLQDILASFCVLLLISIFD